MHDAAILFGDYPYLYNQALKAQQEGEWENLKVIILTDAVTRGHAIVDAAISKKVAQIGARAMAKKGAAGTIESSQVQAVHGRETAAASNTAAETEKSTTLLNGRNTNAAKANTSSQNQQDEFIGDGIRSPKVFDRSQIGKSINTPLQIKHQLGSHSYKELVKVGVHKSPLTVNAQELLNDFHNGSGTIMSNNPGRTSLVVRFNRPIGDVFNEKKGALITKGTHFASIRYAAGKVRITPVNYTSP